MTDIGIAAQSLMLAARGLGLGTVFVKECPPRKPINEIVFYEKWGAGS